ncbi:MAG: ABC transporter substrate-binding protein [Firmicutes bacterium]|nr:ABC transporter substrate-binding protein [Bacillota bacterium]
MKRKIILGLMCLVLILSLSACGSSTSSSTDEAKHLNVGVNFFPKAFDPANDFDGWHTFRYGVGEALVKFTDSFEIEPNLATEWKKTDDTTWVITLRSGVKFHNGKEMDGEAVKASLLRTIGLNKRAAGDLKIAEIQVEGMTLTVKTTEANPNLMGYLGDPYATIVDVEAANADPEGFKINPICTGPFICTEFVSETKAELQAFSDYWDGKAKIETATYVYMADADARLMALQSGELDVAINLNNSSISLLEADKAYQVSTTSSTRMTYAMINPENEFLADKNLRVAINQALDKENYVNEIMYGLGTAGVGPYPPVFDYVTNQIKGFSFDRAAAKKILADNGYVDSDGDGYVEKNGKKVTLKLSAPTVRPEIPGISTAMVADLKEIGIELQIVTYDAKPADEYKAGNFDIGINSYSTSNDGHPLYNLTYGFAKDGTANYHNYFYNSELKTIIKQLKTEFDSDKQDRLAEQAQQLIIDEALNIFLVYPNNTYASKSTVSGFDAHPIDYYLINNKTDIK